MHQLLPPPGAGYRGQIFTDPVESRRIPPRRRRCSLGATASTMPLRAGARGRAPTSSAPLTACMGRHAPRAWTPPPDRPSAPPASPSRALVSPPTTAPRGPVRVCVPHSPCYSRPRPSPLS
ncbi:hypothetical protein D1007_45571 [Hordeum vulgare]|nr:hypothetical protein D1007_45571 [Hordeum vulgare]